MQKDWKKRYQSATDVITALNPPVGAQGLRPNQSCTIPQQKPSTSSKPKPQTTVVSPSPNNQPSKSAIAQKITIKTPHAPKNTQKSTIISQKNVKPHRSNIIQPPPPPSLPTLPPNPLTPKWPKLQCLSLETVILIPEYSKLIYQTQQRKVDYFTVQLSDRLNLEMIAIPAGKFLMGVPTSEEGSDKSERPQHWVTLQPFFLGKYPVTQAQYEAIMGNNPSCFKGQNRPVERVYWENAVEFCWKLSDQTGLNFNLPSEAQWEYACRAGTTTPFVVLEIVGIFIFRIIRKVFVLCVFFDV